MEKPFDLTAVACYHTNGDDMYNAEVKERFLSTIEDEKSAKTMRNYLRKFSDAESISEKDIAQMDAQEAITATKKINAKSKSTVRNALTNVKKYVSWCVNNSVLQDCEGGFMQIGEGDIESEDPDVYILSENDLISSMRKACDFSECSPGVPYLLFTWLGMDKKEIIGLKDSQVDLERRVVYGKDGELLIRDFSENIRDILEDYRNCKVVYMYGTNKPVYRDMSLDTFLKRFTTKPSYIGKPYSVSAVEAQVGIMNEAYKKMCHESKLTPLNVARSGRFFRLFITEYTLGDDITADRNRALFDEIMKSAGKSQRSRKDDINMYREYKKARLTQH